MTEVILFTTFIMVLLLPYSNQVIIDVDICPTDKQSWTQRSSRFLCEDSQTYHCIQNENTSLVETCMRKYTVNSYKVGCPWVKIHGGKSYLGHPFFQCNETLSGCPENQHKKYSTDKLYMYPACILSDNRTTSNVTHSVYEKSANTATTKEINYESISIISVLSSLLVVSFLVNMLTCIRRHRSKSNEENTEGTAKSIETDDSTLRLIRNMEGTESEDMAPELYRIVALQSKLKEKSKEIHDLKQECQDRQASQEVEKEQLHKYFKEKGKTFWDEKFLETKSNHEKRLREDEVWNYELKIEQLTREKEQCLADRNMMLKRFESIIQHLYDDNRPERLVEKFSELYDNEWTDAMETLEHKINTVGFDAAQSLLKLTEAIYKECLTLANKQYDDLFKSLGLHGTIDNQKKMKDFLKSIAPGTLPYVSEVVINKCISVYFGDLATHCQTYIDRCIEICWYMCVQDPPVTVAFGAKKGDDFDDKIYKPYKKTGSKIDNLVRPAIYRFENGPLLQKGIVQPQ